MSKIAVVIDKEIPPTLQRYLEDELEKAARLAAQRAARHGSVLPDVIVVDVYEVWEEE